MLKFFKSVLLSSGDSVIVFNQIIKLNKADNAHITNASDTTNVSDTADILNNIKADSIMIGDRKDDILGAKNCGIESIGVRYGFAEENELENAGADYIVENVQDIITTLDEM